jgi:hypothetical protein
MNASNAAMLRKARGDVGMKKEVAKHIAASAMRCATRLDEILPFAKAHCTDAEYRQLAISIASVVHSISEEIIEKTFSRHPNLKKEFEDSIKKFGVVV